MHRSSTVLVLTALIAAALAGFPFPPVRARALAPSLGWTAAQPEPCDGAGDVTEPPPRDTTALRLVAGTDRPSYAIGEPVTVSLSVTNLTDAPLVYWFPGPPVADFVVRSEATGSEVWRFSRSAVFPLPTVICTFAPGQTVTFSELWDQRRLPLRSPLVPPGEYTLTAMLGLAENGGPASEPVRFIIDASLPPQPRCGPRAPIDSVLRPWDPQPVLTVSTDRPAYGRGEPVTFTLTVANPSDMPLTLRTSFIADFRVTSAATGVEVWRLSDTSIPTPPYSYCTLPPGAAANFTAVRLWDQRDRSGQQVPPGVYTVTGRVYLVGGEGSPPLQFTIGVAPPPGEDVRLVPGCNNLSLTWPNATPIATVAAAVSPPDALIAVWRHDAAQGRFLGYSAQLPHAADLVAVDRFEAVFICTRAASTLTRPAVVR